MVWIRRFSEWKAESKDLKMAANNSVDISKLSEVFPLTWSVDTKHDVFQRWSQGSFSLVLVDICIQVYLLTAELLKQ